MTKLQKKNHVASQREMPLTLQAGVSPNTKHPLLSSPTSDSIIPGPAYESIRSANSQANTSRPATGLNSNPSLSPFRGVHLRSASVPLPEWPLKYIKPAQMDLRSPSQPRLMPLTSSPSTTVPPLPKPHASGACGTDCSKCGKKKIAPLKALPPETGLSFIPPKPIPKAHMRSVSESAVPRFARLSPPRINTLNTPTTPNALESCHTCGKYKRPASMPIPQRLSPPLQQCQQQSPKALQPLPASSPLRKVSPNILINGLPISRPPSPPTPDPENSNSNFNPFASPEDHIISPLSIRKRRDFPIISTSPQSQPQSNSSGTGSLITLIATALRDTSPSPPTSTGLGISGVLLRPRPTSLLPPFELDSTPLHDTTPTILVQMERDGIHDRSKLKVQLPERNPSFSTHDDEKLDLGVQSNETDTYNYSQNNTSSKSSILHLTLHDIPSPTLRMSSYYSYSNEREADTEAEAETETDADAHRGSFAEHAEHDWTNSLSLSRLPSVKEGLSRFKSLRGGGGLGSRFGSLRRNGNGNANGGGSGDRSSSTTSGMQQGWYGGERRYGGGSGYQPLLEVDAY